jgi:hypothetical protein
LFATGIEVDEPAEETCSELREAGGSVRTIAAALAAEATMSRAMFIA